MKTLLSLLFGLLLGQLYAQSYTFHFEPISHANWPGLQSYALGEHNGEWLVVGGRQDGLHRRQPWASFDAAGRNVNIYVLNPTTGQKWSVSVDSLPQPLKDQWSSSNIQFEQHNGSLVLIGGYGITSTTNTHITFPVISRVHIAQAIAAVKNNGLGLKQCVQWRTDERMAVTGGQLLWHDNAFVLAGGHRFDGAYNPMGHATYVQSYTHSVAFFSIQDSANTFKVGGYTAHVDSNLLHRRDWNVLPIQKSQTQSYLVGYSGVFQPQVNLPYTDGIGISADSVWLIPGFSQLLNQYHTASLGIYDSIHDVFEAVFFGGIAQYTPTASGGFASDLGVPFVKTVSAMRSAANGWSEHVLPVLMPGYRGSSAEFIPLPTAPFNAEGILQKSQLVGDSTAVGIIYGGIESTSPNVFFTNTGTQSSAHPGLLKVWMITSGLGRFEPKEATPFAIQSIFTRQGSLEIEFHSVSTAPLTLRMYDMNGRLQYKHTYSKPEIGMYRVPWRLSGAGLVEIEQEGLLAKKSILNVR